MKIKAVILLCLTCSIIKAQNLAFKGILFYAKTKNTTYSVADGGVELKLNKYLSTQLSASYANAESEEGHKQIMITPQLRFYPKANKRHNTFYTAAFLQWHKDSKRTNFSGHILRGFDDNDSERWGAGLMLGFQLKMYENWGWDFHVGYVWANGKETSTRVFSDGRKINNPDIVKNFPRPIWGMNLYYFLNKKTAIETKN